MTGFGLLPMFLIGMLGSVHCVAMCGPIVGALSLAGPARRGVPIALPTRAPLPGALRLACYNSGRIGSYMAAGALAGGAANGARLLAGVSPLQMGGYWLANAMLVALGLYLMGAWQGVARLEALGRFVWQRIQPWTRALLPLDTPLKSLAAGALWGWLPCGMVYSVLLTAMLSGSAGAGALLMLAFGLGTLPALLALGVLGKNLNEVLRRRGVRHASGILVAGFGVLGLWRAAHGMAPAWLATLCLGGAP